jgi:hypothetical protein
MINFIYILILLILLILLTYTPYEKHVVSDNIIVEINNDIIKTNTVDATIYLNFIRTDLLKFNNFDKLNQLDTDSQNELHKLIDVCAIDMSRLKKANNLDYNFGHQFYYDDMVYSRSDVTYNQFDRLKLSNLIFDVDMALYLLKNNTIYGRLTLTNLYKLVEKLKSDQDNIYKSVLEESTTEDNYYHNDYVHEGKIPAARSNKVVRSQESKGFGNLRDDGEDFANDDFNILLSVKPKIQKKAKAAMNTQALGESDTTYVTNKNCIKNYLPFCDLTKIRNDREKAKYLIDQNSRQSLANDYNF